MTFFGGFQINKIKQIQGRVIERLLIDQGIDGFNSAQGIILFVLWEDDGITITRLSEKTGLAKTTLTGMLDRLEQIGYIKRNYDPEDRRKVRILITDSAKDLMDKYHHVLTIMNDCFYDGFSEEEINLLEGYLDRILNNLSRKEGKRCKTS